MAGSKVDKPGAVDFVSFAFEAQRAYPADKPLFIDAQDPGRSLNYAQTRSLVRKLISGLKASGLGKGDRVLLSVANNYLYAALLYGIIGAGGVACGVNPAWKVEELNHVLRQSEAKLIVATSDSLLTVLKAADTNSIATDRIFLLDDLNAPLDSIASITPQADSPQSVVDGWPQLGRTIAPNRFTDLLRHGEADWLSLDSEQAAKETPAIYYPTSGTSGLPKLAVLSHHNLVMQHRSLYQPVPYRPVVRVLCLPCFHVFGAAWLLGFPLRYGEPAYVMRRFRLETYVRHLARYGATEAYLTPPIVHMLNRASASLPVRRLFATVRWAGVGGAPIDAAALRRFRASALHPAATLSQVWGMTEVGAACLFRYGDPDADPAAAGRVLENYEIRLVGRDGGLEGAAGDRVPAELFVRSPNVMMGYKGTVSPREEDHNGWFPTGDLVRVEDGKVYVVGRNKELIKTKGWQVAPAEIEALILQHPGVRDCAVVGVRSDDGTTEVPRAYVVRKARGDGGGGLASLAASIYWREKKSALGYEVYGLVAERLASYKRLEGGVVFVDAIPRTASGKTQRFKLVGEVEELDGGEADHMEGRSSPPMVWAQECFAVAKSSLKKGRSLMLDGIWHQGSLLELKRDKMQDKANRRWLNSLMRFGFKAGDTLVNVVRVVPRAFVVGMLSGWLISHIAFPAHANRWLRELSNHPYLWSITLVFLVLAFDALVVYPRMRDPLRSLPNSRRCSTMLVESPRGKSALAAMKDHPDASLIRLEGRYAVLCAGHDALRDVLSTHAGDFEKPWPIRSFLARPLGWGVIVNEGPLHHRQRRILNPAFHVAKIRMLYGLMWTKVLIFAQKLEEIIHEAPKQTEDGWAEVEIAELASRLTLDIIGPAAMGRDFQSLTSNESNISDAYQELLRPTFGRMIFGGLNFMLPQWIVQWLPLSSNRILDEISSFLKKTCGEILEDKKREIAEGKDSLPDYSILKRIIETGELTDEETKDQMLTFLAAGHETTAGALTWACYLCATNPDVQRKLRAEIHTRLEYVGGQPPEGVGWDVLESMPYLNGFCEEVLRLYPTVPVTVREAQRATTVAGHRAPRGTLFVLVPYATNRHPRAWGADADRVVPERWIDTDPATGVARPNKTGGTTSNFASLTFLHGPRACIGQDFAKAELRCAVAGLVGGFEVQLRENQEEPRISGVITAKAEGGMRLLFRKAAGEEEADL